MERKREKQRGSEREKETERGSEREKDKERVREAAVQDSNWHMFCVCVGE